MNFPPFQLFSLLWRRITNQKPVCWLVIIDFQLYLSALLVALNYSHKVSFVNMKQVNSLSPSPSNCTNSFPVKRIWQRLEMLSLSLFIYFSFQLRATVPPSQNKFENKWRMRKPRGGLCAGQNVDTVQPAKIGKENKHYFSQERIRSRLMVGIKLSTKQLMYKTDHRPRERGPPPPHTIGPPHVIILFRFVQPMGKETRSARLPVKHISHHPGRAATTDNSVFDRITF